jgi:preprotein translocase subunit SecG
MSMLLTVVFVFHILVAATIIGLVLLQHGKGADMGAAFGSGSSGSLFGATGSANFLSRMTAGAATLFFCTSIALTWLASHHQGEASGVMKGSVEAPATPAAAAVPPASKEAPKPDAAPADAGKVPVPGGAAPAPAKGTEVPK